MYSDYIDAIRIIRKTEALAFIAYREMLHAKVGRGIMDRAQAHQSAARHKYNMQRLQTMNRKLAVLRHRTHQ